MSIEEYNRISPKSIAQFVLNPEQFKPVPSQSDYTRGWIYRYFLRKINDEFGTIFELSKRQYDIFSKFNLYTTIRIEWNISDPYVLDDDMGAIEFNRKRIRKGMLSISNLNIYFNNLLEFHKDGGRVSVGFLLPMGQRLRDDGVIIQEAENKIIGRIIK